MDGGRAGVAGSRAKDIDRSTVARDLVLEEIADELESEILEGKGWAVEQLEDEGVVPELPEWRGIGWLVEGGVGTFDERAQVGGRMVGVEERKKPEGEVRVSGLRKQAVG